MLLINCLHKQKCTKCHHWRPISLFYPYRNDCKICISERGLRRYEEKHDEICAKTNAYKHADPDRWNTYYKQYAAENNTIDTKLQKADAYQLRKLEGRIKKHEPVYDGQLKTCQLCGISQPKTEFHIQVSCVDGLRTYCKTCGNGNKKEYDQKTGYKAQRSWQERNPEWMAEHMPIHWKDHKMRRKQKCDQSGWRMTKKWWDDLLALYEFTCAYCRKVFDKLEPEHIIPLARGGSHSPDNIVPACHKCNSKKSSKTPEEFGTMPLILTR